METSDAAVAARWLVAADLVYVAGGAVAYLTTVSAVLLAVFALIPAMPGVAAARRAAADDQQHDWADRALSAAAGTFALAAMLVLIPYMAAEGGDSLWADSAFAATGLGIVSLGFLFWNAAAFQSLSTWDMIRNGRLYAAFHGVLIVAAIGLVLAGDGASHTIMFRGQTIEAWDLKTAPALAAVGGVVWAAAFLRIARERA